VRPERAWFGIDYLDPTLKNFIFRDGQAVIIDSESLSRESLLGTGIAKCQLHWLRGRRDEFADRIVALGAPDIRPQLDYAQLLLVAGWSKRKLLSGKRHRIQFEHFERCLKKS